MKPRLADMGLALPPPVEPPPGVELPFQFVRMRKGIAYISGHGPQNADGTVAGPFGKLGADVTVEQGYAAAQAVGLSMLGSLERALGDLDRVTHWLRLHGMVNSAPDFMQQPAGHQRLLASDPVAVRGGAGALTRGRRWAWRRCLLACAWRLRERWRFE